MRTSIGGVTRRRLNLAEFGDLVITPFGELLTVLGEESDRGQPSRNGVPSPDWLLGAAEDAGFRFDALVVDEAQEFTPGLLEALMLLLPDPDESPVYLFADPFQHSALFSANRMGRERMRGRYKWRPPDGIPLVTLVDNVRNSEPIARAVRHFLADQRSVARVTGPDPEVVKCPPKQVVQTGLQRVKKLLSRDGFSANQVLLVVAGIDKGSVMREAGKVSLDVVDVKSLVRFPLPPTDLRVPVGVPDDVQGLEAEVVVVLHATQELAIGDVRDLYVAASRARSHLVVVAGKPLAQLQSAAQAALSLAADEASDDR
jgi:hypothetical protein